MKVLADYNTWKEFPTMPKTVPDEILSNDWALKIHDQTLKRLNERGGMSVLELLMNINRITGQEFMRRANKRTTQSDVDELLKIIETYERTR